MPLELKRDDLFDLPDPNSEEYRVPRVTITADGLVFEGIDDAMGEELEEELEEELDEELVEELDDAFADDGEA